MKLDVFEIGKRVKLPCRAFDEQGREVPHVRWIDPAEGTYGQLVTDENGRPQFDPEDHDQVWEITRFGKLRLKSMSDGDR